MGVDFLFDDAAQGLFHVRAGVGGDLAEAKIPEADVGKPSELIDFYTAKTISGALYAAVRKIIGVHVGI